MSTSKISDAYRYRLGHLPNNQFTRAIVLLKPSAPRHSLRGLPAAKREEHLAAERTLLRGAIAQIDDLLVKLGGKRVSKDVNALGTIVVEATSSAVIALSQLDVVDSIMEDQPVSNLD